MLLHAHTLYLVLVLLVKCLVCLDELVKPLVQFVVDQAGECCDKSS